MATRRGDSQQRILDAAVHAFAERGYHGTTTRDIAERAGMSPAALYLHYSSKEDLLFAISGAGNEHTRDLVQAAAAAGVTPTERLRAVVHDFVLWHATHHTSGRIVNHELASLSSEHRAQVDEQRRAIKQVFRSIIEAGIATGEFVVTDPSIVTMAVVSLGIDVSRWYSEEKAWQPAYVADHFADLALLLVNANTAKANAGKATGEPNTVQANTEKANPAKGSRKAEPETAGTVKGRPAAAPRPRTAGRARGPRD